MDDMDDGLTHLYRSRQLLSVESQNYNSGGGSKGQNMQDSGRDEHKSDILTLMQRFITHVFVAGLQLDVKGCKDVYASVDKYVEVEHLEDDNKYHAEQHGLQEDEEMLVPHSDLVEGPQPLVVEGPQPFVEGPQQMEGCKEGCPVHGFPSSSSASAKAF